MTREFELFVALRYLRAKRKQAVISIITVISILGVAAGVMALVIALGINNGFRGTLQRNLLGATAHISVLEKEPGSGIENWRELVQKAAAIPGVQGASPSLYNSVMVTGLQGSGAVLKGIDPASAHLQPESITRLKAGSFSRLAEEGRMPGIVLGSRLAERTGMMLNSVVTVLSPTGELTPFGPTITPHRFRVVGIFESGFYEFDANWAYTSLKSAQMVLSLRDVVNSIELRVNDIYKAPEIARRLDPIIGTKLAAADWMEMNKPVLGALKMERTVTIITISMIQLIAALNILIGLVIIVMEKGKDVAVLMSMGARVSQIRWIFICQGLIIGVLGTILGLIAGYTICYFANTYRWLRLDEEVYSLSFVPFEPNPWDAIWIAAVAIGISFIATLYPARNAAKIAPVEALRYE